MRISSLLSYLYRRNLRNIFQSAKNPPISAANQHLRLLPHMYVSQEKNKNRQNKTITKESYIIMGLYFVCDEGVYQVQVTAKEVQLEESYRTSSVFHPFFFFATDIECRTESRIKSLGSRQFNRTVS